MELYITRTTNSWTGESTIWNYTLHTPQTVELVSQVSVTVHRTSANCQNDLVCAHVQTNLLCTLIRVEHAMNEEMRSILTMKKSRWYILQLQRPPGGTLCIAFQPIYTMYIFCSETSLLILLCMQLQVSTTLGIHLFLSWTDQLIRNEWVRVLHHKYNMLPPLVPWGMAHSCGYLLQMHRQHIHTPNSYLLSCSTQTQG